MSDQQHFYDTSMHQKIDKGKLVNSGRFTDRHFCREVKENKKPDITEST